MTVEELIKQLKAYPPDMRVMVNGYETGFDDPNQLRVEEVELNTNDAAWDGKYERARSDHRAIKALIIPRKGYET